MLLRKILEGGLQMTRKDLIQTDAADKQEEAPMVEQGKESTVSAQEVVAMARDHLVRAVQLLEMLR